MSETTATTARRQGRPPVTVNVSVKAKGRARVNVTVNVTDPRPHAKGTVYDFHTLVRTDGETVWEETSSYLRRGRGDESASSGTTFRVKPVGAAPSALTLKTTLNGSLMQDASTNLMVYDTWQLIEFISRHSTLRAGDVIATGTPFGVGGFREIFLKDKDVVRIELEGVGVLENAVEAS